MAGSKKGALRLYKSYRFREKDPIIDAVRTAVQDTGMSYAAVYEASGVSASTVYNWFHGTTKRPQFATVAAVAVACGKRGVRFDAKGRAFLID